MSEPSPNPTRTAPDDKEEIYFEGSPRSKETWVPLLTWIFIAVVLIAVAIGLTVATSGGAWLSIPIALLIAAAIIAYPVITTRLRRYKITNYRIDFERGFLSKSIDTLELWHVEDIKFNQSIWDRMFGVGTLTVISHDDTTPSLIMKGLPEPRKLFDLLKQRVISVKRQRGVLKLDT